MKAKKFLGIVLAVTMLVTENAGILSVTQGAEFSDGDNTVEDTENDLENVDTEENTDIFGDSNDKEENILFESGENDSTDEVDTKIIEDEDTVTEPASSNYSMNFREWSQGQSDYQQMVEGGCWIVAQAKLLYETGVDRSDSFNPDSYMLWQRRNNLADSKLGQINGEEAPLKYAQEKGKTREYLEYLGEWAATENQFWDNINKGYYTIIRVPGHYVYLDNQKSKEEGKLYCDDSSIDNFWTGPRKLSDYGIYETSYVYKHEHLWDAGKITKMATCTEEGERTFTCSCGATDTKEISVTDHNWSNWKIVKETKKGQEKQRKCNVCGQKEKKIEKIPFILKVTSSVFYNGKEQKPAIKVYKGTKRISAWYYNVTYKNNIDVGKATINVKGKGQYSNCAGKITFEIKANFLNKTHLSLEPKKYYQLKINNAIKKKNWISSAPGIVKVDKKGKVIAQKAGTATISVWMNGQKLKCKVTVQKKTHRYELIENGLTWEEAEKACEKLGGHLVTITSAEEQQIVENLLKKKGKKNFYWLGIKRDKNGRFSEWITEEKIKYTHFDTENDEPNNFAGRENVLVIYRIANPRGGYSSALKWNDLCEDGNCNDESFFGKENSGYICEWE